jgi:hypothetical protein
MTLSGLNATFSIVATTRIEQTMQFCWNAPQGDLYALGPGKVFVVSYVAYSELCARLRACITRCRYCFVERLAAIMQRWLPLELEKTTAAQKEVTQIAYTLHHNRAH